MRKYYALERNTDFKNLEFSVEFPSRHSPALREGAPGLGPHGGTAAGARGRAHPGTGRRVPPPRRWRAPAEPCGTGSAVRGLTEVQELLHGERRGGEARVEVHLLRNAARGGAARGGAAQQGAQQPHGAALGLLQLGSAQPGPAAMARPASSPGPCAGRGLPRRGGARGVGVSPARPRAGRGRAEPLGPGRPLLRRRPLRCPLGCRREKLSGLPEEPSPGQTKKKKNEVASITPWLRIMADVCGSVSRSGNFLAATANSGLACILLTLQALLHEKVLPFSKGIPENSVVLTWISIDPHNKGTPY
ncbi:translation initiation factor IF-2-like [Apus apus]|uniref:translation initiation factor IF-2-like n=1 Tax=Apus apus TaxID=8895 RepID=UPI0021F84FA2|nr:translation initiation factor IF-2-like [Apus apus]